MKTVIKSFALIKQLRDRTGFSKEDCKKALLYSNYDIDKAYILLYEVAIGRTSFYDVELKRYKDIEDELGIDLITLFNALKNGIYGKIGNKIEHILAPHFSFYNQEIYIFKIKDYGKTWALTEEELQWVSKQHH